MAKAIPRGWLQGGHHPRLRLIHWEAEAKGHYDEAIRPTAGNDFGDNRVPGKGQKVRKSLTERPELDNQPTQINTHCDGARRFPARSVPRRGANPPQAVRDDVRKPAGAALRVAFPAPSGCREGLPMGRIAGAFPPTEGTGKKITKGVYLCRLVFKLYPPSGPGLRPWRGNLCAFAGRSGPQTRLK